MFIGTRILDFELLAIWLWDGWIWFCWFVGMNFVFNFKLHCNNFKLSFLTKQCGLKFRIWKIIISICIVICVDMLVMWCRTWSVRWYVLVSDTNSHCNYNIILKAPRGTFTDWHLVLNLLITHRSWHLVLSTHRYSNNNLDEKVHYRWWVELMIFNFCFDGKL